jgi:hypothetical protein
MNFKSTLGKRAFPLAYVSSEEGFGAVDERGGLEVGASLEPVQGGVGQSDVSEQTRFIQVFERGRGRQSRNAYECGFHGTKLPRITG